MKRVLYVWKGAYPWDIRVEKFCNSLLSSGFNVHLLARWDGEEHENDDLGFQVNRVGFKKSKFLSEPIPHNPIWKSAIRNEINEFKPDLIIVREFFLVDSVVSIARKKNIPVVFDMAEYYPEAMRGWKNYYNKFYWRIIVHYLKIPDYLDVKAMNSADGIIVVCDELALRVLSVSNKTTDEVTVVHNTPERKLFENFELNTKNPPKNFAYHGYFSLDRNLETLVKAFIKASEIDSEIRLILAGTGENFEEIKTLITGSVYPDRIKLLGEYKFDSILSLYENTDVAVLPYKNNSFINHTISNKLFDYMATGKPMIVSEAEPMRRIINEVNAGIICNCDNVETLSKAILSMKEHDLKSFSLAGRKAFEEKYNWEVDSANMIKFIERFI